MQLKVHELYISRNLILTIDLPKEDLGDH